MILLGIAPKLGLGNGVYRVPMDLSGKHVVVTGGANGIGRALCERFSKEGARVTVADLDVTAAEAVAASFGGTAHRSDVAIETDVIDLVETAEADQGPIDLFCSNAGVGGDGGVEAPDEVWHRNWAVNVMAHVYAARILIPRMTARGGGYLLQTVSAAGILTSPGAAPYAAAKHAAIGLAEFISITYGGQGIKVSCLCPQAVNTRLLMEQSDPTVMRAMLAVADLIEPADVAAAVVTGLAREDFYIFPHPEAHEYYVRRASDPDRWLRGMRRFLESPRRATPD